MSTVFCSISCLERTEIYEKEPGDGPFKKISRLIMLLLLYQLQQICRLDCSSKTLFCSSSLQLFILRPHDRSNERTNKRTNETNETVQPKYWTFFEKHLDYNKFVTKDDDKLLFKLYPFWGRNDGSGIMIAFIAVPKPYHYSLLRKSTTQAFKYDSNPDPLLSEVTALSTVLATTTSILFPTRFTLWQKNLFLSLENKYYKIPF